MVSDLRYVAVNGVKLGYEVYGEVSGNPPALFVHGYGSRSTGPRSYPALLNALAGEFTVYALDLRGHGASASQIEGWSLSAIADDVAAATRELGLTGALYIGHSIGGFTGMFCEVRHPNTFSAMCLLTPASAAGGAHDGQSAAFMIEHGRDPEFLKAAFAPMYIHGHDGSINAENVGLVDRRVHEAFFPELLERVIIEDVRGIDIPVLVLNGGLDSVVPLAEQHRTAVALPNCKEVNYMGEGHMLPREAPGIAAREIIAFWKHDVGKTLPFGHRRPPLQTAARS